MTAQDDHQNEHDGARRQHKRSDAPDEARRDDDHQNEHDDARSYLLPPGRIIRRARDWRLYDAAGNRYVDFWQADGAAFLGHRPTGLARTVAAEIDRGLWAPVPTAWPRRLEKALAALARRAGVPSLTIGPAGRRWRPLSGTTPEEGLPATPATDASDAGEDVYHVTLPFPLMASFDGGAMMESTLSLRSEATTESDGAPHTAPTTTHSPSAPQSLTTTHPLRLEELSPVLLSGLVVAAGNLLRYLDSAEAKQRIELARSLPVPPGFRLHGVYWFAEQPTEPDTAASSATGDGSSNFRNFRTRALERGIVLPPDPGDPICCPGELGRREVKNWEALCADWPD